VVTVVSKRFNKSAQVTVGKSVSGNLRQTAGTAEEKLVQIAENSLGLVQASTKLSMPPSEITRRVRRRQLYGFRANRLLLLPNFQFSGSRVVRGIEQVVPQLDPRLHPIEVVNWFTNRHTDLVLDGDLVSPLAWLKAGHDVQKVAELAKEVGGAPIRDRSPRCTRR
jgi:hypothetical protein